MKRTFARGRTAFAGGRAALEEPRAARPGSATYRTRPRSSWTSQSGRARGRRLLRWCRAVLGPWGRRHGLIPLRDFDAANVRRWPGKAYATWLQRELKPNAHGSYALGQELFLKKLKYAEGVDAAERPPCPREAS